MTWNSNFSIFLLFIGAYYLTPSHLLFFLFSLDHGSRAKWQISHSVLLACLQPFYKTTRSHESQCKRHSLHGLSGLNHSCVPSVARLMKRLRGRGRRERKERKEGGRDGILLSFSSQKEDTASETVSICYTLQRAIFTLTVYLPLKLSSSLSLFLSLPVLFTCCIAAHVELWFHWYIM